MGRNTWLSPLQQAVIANELPDWPPQGPRETHVLLKISVSIFTPVDKSPLIINLRVTVHDAGQTCTGCSGG